MGDGFYGEGVEVLFVLLGFYIDIKVCELER